jgi:chitinase
VSAAQEAAIRKYARAVVELITKNGFDGYDLDWEAQWTRGSLASYSERLFIYIDEMSKYFGPQSGTEKLLIVDG